MMRYLRVPLLALLRVWTIPGVLLTGPSSGSQASRDGEGDLSDAEPGYRLRKDFNRDCDINILDVVRLTPTAFSMSCQ